MEAPPGELPTGATIGPYLVIDRLGGGGMGEVYLASDTRLHRRVALKRLTAPRSTAEERARIRQEARAAARVSHPNVATVHDILEHDGHAFIVMEYVEGESLAERLRRGPLAPAEVVAFGRQLAAGLGAAHARGIVHRDLKPGNVQIGIDGTLKILDFGVSQVASVTATTTGVPDEPRHARAGTPAYMAPEQWAGGTVDCRSDIYSLGLTLFEMTTGVRPFAVGGTTESALRGGRAPRADDVTPGVPRALADVIARALELDPEARFQTATGLGDALAASLGDRGTAARSRRMRRVAAAAAAMLLAASGITAYRWWRAPPALRHQGPPTVAVLPFASDGGSDEPLASGMTAILVADLSTVRGLTLVPSTAAAKYAHPPYPYADLAKDLGVQYAVTGAVNRRGQRIEVTLGLVDLRTGKTQSSPRFEDVESELGSLNDRASSWAVDRVRALAGDGPEPARPAVTRDARAFEDYAQARRYIESRDEAGNIDQAIAALERAVRRDPSFALAYASLGEADWYKYGEVHEPEWADRAKDATLEALRLDPDQPMVRYGLALIYLGTGRRTEAVDELKRAIAQQPSSDDLHRLLGSTYADLGRLDDAVPEFLIAQQLRPGFWDNYRALGLAYYDAGRYADAVAAFRRLTELQPDNGFAFQMLGVAYHQLGDLDQALENYGRANALRPSAAAWSNIGTIRYGRKEFSQAAAAYRESFRLNPKQPTTLRNLGDALMHLGDRRDAIEQYRAAIALCRSRLAIEHDNVVLTALEAVCLAKIGQIAGAQARIAAALAVNPRSPDALYKRAVIDLFAGDRAAALAALRDALEAGYSRTLAAEDDDLRPLAQDPAFIALVGKSEQ